MPKFDADAYLEALEKPTLTINGTTFTGRILSIVEWLPFEQRMEALSDDNNTDGYMAFARDYLRALFPYRMAFKWRGDPVAMTLNHPGLTTIVTDFLALQIRAVTGNNQTRKMSGTNSAENQ